MQFWKYQGAGNDFILVDQREEHWLGRENTDKIALLCDRHFGIGADGLILLQAHPEVDFEMVYFNADGRESTMCGNGGRCIAAFARHLGMHQDTLRFQAIDGLHEAILTTTSNAGQEWVELKMQNVDGITSLENQNGQPPSPPEYVLNTGSPHFVRFVDSVQGLDVRQMGAAVRYSDPFRLKGINVNFVETGAGGTLRIRTYERGVEDETLACGTGVTAAALAFAYRQGLASGNIEVPVNALGGELLVRFAALGNGHYTDIWLCGPATRVFEGKITFPIIKKPVTAEP